MHLSQAQSAQRAGKLDKAQALYRQALISQPNNPEIHYKLAMLLDMPLHKIRVIPTEVGGAFGGKESVRLSALCVALSRQAGLPVRLTLSREEVLRATGPSCAPVATVTIGAR